MGAVKVDFTIPKELEERLRKSVEAGQRSIFVAAAIRDRLEAIERQRLEAELEAGYQEMSEEHRRLVRAAQDAQSMVALRDR